MDWTLLAAALLLAPIVYLFRFVGCTLILRPNGDYNAFLDRPDEEPEALRPTEVDLRVMFYPDPGTDGDDYRVEVEFDPEVEDRDPDTVTWPPPPGQSAGSWQWHPADEGALRRLLYVLDAEITEGDYLITCRVFRAGETTTRFEAACAEPVTLALDTDLRVRFGQAPDGPEAPFEADECPEAPGDGG